LKDVQLGKVDGASSALSFDELVWAVKRHRSIEDSLIAGDAFLNMPKLKLVAVNADLLASALRVMREYRLDPRDSIHAASALSEGAETIISEDKHFDRVKEVGRKGISHA
jgi:predicted nucleic acid-binding protein